MFSVFLYHNRFPLVQNSRSLSLRGKATNRDANAPRWVAENSQAHGTVVGQTTGRTSRRDSETQLPLGPAAHRGRLKFLQPIYFQGGRTFGLHFVQFQLDSGAPAGQLYRLANAPLRREGPQEDTTSLVVGLDGNIAPDYAGYQDGGRIHFRRVARQLNPAAEGPKLHLNVVIKALAHGYAHGIAAQHMRPANFLELLALLIGQRRTGASEARVSGAFLGRQSKLRPGRGPTFKLLCLFAIDVEIGQFQDSIFGPDPESWDERHWQLKFVD